MQAQKKGDSTSSDIADRLNSAAIHLLRRIRKQDMSLAQAPAQLSALSILVFGGPRSVGELAAAEQVKPPTMSRIVAGLERERLVRRLPSGTDGRRVTLEATPKGIQLMQTGRLRRIKYLAGYLAVLTNIERRTLSAGLAILEGVLRDWK